MNLAKPEPGAFRRERHERRTATRKHERDEMAAAKRRDHGKCRWPGCDSATVGLRIDACHKRASHRGMGGNPAGDKTERSRIITLCQLHHRQYDTFEIGIDPLTAHEFSGPCAFYRGEQHIASEKVIGVSSTRSQA